MEEASFEGVQFVLVRGGVFAMGDVLNEGDDDEKPVFDANVPDFYIGKYTISFTQYDSFCDSVGIAKLADEGWGRASHPAVNMTWFQAVQYCEWLSKETGRSIRLPTETEWEYAAREGGKLVRFGNGQEIARDSEINFDARPEHKENYSEVGAYRGMTVPVGSFRPNGLGIHEMSGNVWELCANPYTSDYKLAGYPKYFRALRGGAFDTYPRHVRATSRGWDNGNTWSPNRGFRVLAEC